MTDLTVPAKNEAVQLLDMMTSFGASPKLVNEGRWVGFPHPASPYKFQIARLNNRGQRTAASRMMLEKAEIFRAGESGGEAAAAAEAELQKLSIKVMAAHLLKGWTPNISFDGKTPVGEYTVEKAEQLLTQFEDFRNWVEDQSQQWGEYHSTAAAAEEEAKN